VEEESHSLFSVSPKNWIALLCEDVHRGMDLQKPIYTKRRKPCNVWWVDCASCQRVSTPITRKETKFSDPLAFYSCTKHADEINSSFDFRFESKMIPKSNSWTGPSGVRSIAQLRVWCAKHYSMRSGLTWIDITMQYIQAGFWKISRYLHFQFLIKDQNAGKTRPGERRKRALDHFFSSTQWQSLRRIPETQKRRFTHQYERVTS